MLDEGKVAASVFIVAVGGSAWTVQTRRTIDRLE